MLTHVLRFFSFPFFPAVVPLWSTKKISLTWQVRINSLVGMLYFECLCVMIFFLFSPFYWAGFVAQRERAQQDSKVPYKVPHLTQPPFTYERQPQHRDHPTLIRIVRGFFNVPQNYQHSRNCETGPPTYRPYPRTLESLTICR